MPHAPSIAFRHRRSGRAFLTVTLSLAALAGAPAGALAADRLVNGPLVTAADLGTCLVTPCKTIGYATTQAVSGDRIVVSPGTYHENVVLPSGATGETLIGATRAVRPFIDGGAGVAVKVLGAGATVQGLKLHGDTSAVVAQFNASGTVITDNLFDDTALNPSGKVAINTGSATITANDFAMPGAPAGVSRALVANSTKAVDIIGNTFDNYFTAAQYNIGTAAPSVVRDNVIMNVHGAPPGVGVGLFIFGSAAVTGNTIGATPVANGGAIGINLRDFSVPATDVTARNRVFGFPNSGIETELSVAGSSATMRGDVLSNDHSGFVLFGGTSTIIGATVYDNNNFDVYLGSANLHLTMASSIVGAKGIFPGAVGADCSITTSRGPTTTGPSSCDHFQTSASPAFVGPSDYRLTAASPLIDTGDPAAPDAGELDIDGNPRAVVGTDAAKCLPARRDMGAYEFVPAPAFVCPPVPLVDPLPVAPPVIDPPPVIPPVLAPAGLTVLDDSGTPVTVAVDGGPTVRLAAGSVGATLSLKAGTHTVRVRPRKGKVVTATIVLTPGQLGVVVVTTSHRRLRLRATRIAPGVRRLLSLLPGTQRLRVGTAKAKRVRHGAFGTLPAAATRVSVGGGRVALVGHPQLAVLLLRHRRPVAVIRSAP